ncbi:hypothetical protein GLYMA_09G239700v4 [Glycine max]|uniref:non-specific serine/threonine protein kinase n=1 Tax=Glycine max TaxID=3847 RepID=A0A0R0ICM7_SOYBN|nr:hypothetical protein GLYMA_09G239700v4 [Glycine max]
MALPIPNYTLVGALYCILIVSWTCLSIATANGITGNIPYGLGILSKLTYLDLSSNDIKGTISRRPNNIDLDLVVIMKIFLPPTPLLALLCSAYVFHRCCKAGNCMSISKETKNGDMFSIWNYDDIIEATENFDIIYCIGAGGYGSVYKAQLPSEIRRIFKNEVRMLTKIRHRNIVKLYEFCLHNRCMFLLLEYMERGSLYCILRDDIEAVELDWTKRVNIVKGIAHSLSYLHHDCKPAIIHRDVTTKNVLLNLEMEACLSDFGIARLLNSGSSNRTVLDELVSSLRSASSQGILLKDILDPRLISTINKKSAQSLALIATLAFACLHSQPRLRPTMQVMCDKLLTGKPRLTIPFEEISIKQIVNQEL